MFVGGFGGEEGLVGGGEGLGRVVVLCVSWEGLRVGLLSATA